MDPSLARRHWTLPRAGLWAALAALLCLVSPPPAAASGGRDSFSVTVTPRDVWAPSPVTDLAAVPGAEGQLLLQWTAPDGNGFVFATTGPAAGYQIRVATFSVAAVGGSTTTWWNAADDTRALPAPAVSANPPAPAFPGTAQFLLLNRLAPGVTYYAMIVSSDAAGNLSDADVRSVPPGVQANALVFDAAPPAPLGLSVVQTGPANFLASWSSVAAYDLDGYRVYFDSTPPYDFSHSSVTFVAAPSTSAALSGLGVGSYVFKVTALDRGQPRFAGVALESASAGAVAASLVRTNALPQAPFGVALTTAAAAVTLRWMPVARFADGTSFLVSTAPAPNELSAYRVYRATTPVQASWADVSAALSTDTWTWTDLAGGPQYYYHVRAENGAGQSDRSLARTAATRDAFALAPDDLSYFQVSAPETAPLEGAPGAPDTAFLIQVSSRPQDLGGLAGRIMKSLEFDAYQGGRLLDPDFKIAERGVLHLHYELDASSGVTPSAAALRSPSDMSVYWYNGRAWVQLFGKLDPATQTMTVATRFFGRYQLRAVERTGGFAFDQAGVSNRFLTPNGDGRNDNVVFTFDNPRDSAVTARILDRQGRVVADALPTGPTGASLVWDGTSRGRPVPGGVYVYQIRAEGRTYSGTLVIVR